jgi:hypothetical protein
VPRRCCPGWWSARRSAPQDRFRPPGRGRPCPGAVRPGVVEDALREASARTADVYVGGTRQMATVWDNLSTVQRVLEVLEREATLLSMLGGAEGTSIRIGDELPPTTSIWPSSRPDTRSRPGKVESA